LCAACVSGGDGKRDEVRMEQRARRQMAGLFVLVLVFTGLANGLGNNILSNYFNEVYHIDSVQRGFLEIPRESPGILCMVLVAALGCLGNLWMSVLAQALLLIGLAVMGMCAPSYQVMLLFLFLHSLGMHLFMPLSDTISMDLAKEGQVGAALGKFKGVTTLMTMVSACMVFVGFRTGIFTFASTIILPFNIGVICTAVAIILLIRMATKWTGGEQVRNHKLLFRRRYMPYYMVTLAYGCQKRIRIVFAPWVVIQLLGKGADTVALLTIATYLVGTGMAPIIGKLLDRFGVRKLLWLEAGYIGVTFCFMGWLSGRLVQGSFGDRSWEVWIVFFSYVLCVLFEQFNMVHAFMMRSIALDSSEVTQTLSVGVSVDHVMAIVASPVMGLIWNGMGVQYVFYLAAVSALFQVGAGLMIRQPMSVPE
jgi:MFS family permease